MSTTTITVDLSEKVATYTGDMCIRDIVDVVLVGASQSDVSGIILRVLKPDDFAEMAKCDSFSIDGSNFIGELDLSGDALVSEFDGDEPRKIRAFMLQVWNNTTGNQSLLINEKIYIMQNVLTPAMLLQVLTGA